MWCRRSRPPGFSLRSPQRTPTAKPGSRRPRRSPCRHRASCSSTPSRGRRDSPPCRAAHHCASSGSGSWECVEVDRSTAPHRRALRRAWFALTVAVLAASSDPLAHRLAGWNALGPEWWAAWIYVGFAVAALAHVVAPIALLTTLAWFLVAWRRAPDTVPRSHNPCSHCSSSDETPSMLGRHRTRGRTPRPARHRDRPAAAHDTGQHAATHPRTDPRRRPPRPRPDPGPRPRTMADRARELQDEQRRRLNEEQRHSYDDPTRGGPQL